jgi:MFS family permease
MRSVTGLLWAVGGAVAGFAVGVIVGLVIVRITSMTSREGASGYFTIGLGLLGAIGGLVAGLVLFGRSAPAGQGLAYSGSGILGVVGLVAVVALSLWAFVNLREAPLEYDGALANLELEFRVKTAELPPADSVSDWLYLEVQTAKTRPVGNVLWSYKRTDGAFTIIPVVQGPLYRAGNRIIAVRIEGRQNEIFVPRMKRTPDPKADWSAWVRPQVVDPLYGEQPTAPLTPMLELRYRVRPYGQ